MFFLFGKWIINSHFRYYSLSPGMKFRSVEWQVLLGLSKSIVFSVPPNFFLVSLVILRESRQDLDAEVALELLNKMNHFQNNDLAWLMLNSGMIRADFYESFAKFSPKWFTFSCRVHGKNIRWITKSRIARYFVSWFFSIINFYWISNYLFGVIMQQTDD